MAWNGITVGDRVSVTYEETLNGLGFVTDHGEVIDEDDDNLVVRFSEDFVAVVEENGIVREHRPVHRTAEYGEHARVEQ